MIHEALTNISLGALLAAMAVAFLGSNLLGSFLGRRMHARGDEDKDASTLAGRRWACLPC